jgi:hypothetical protein
MKNGSSDIREFLRGFSYIQDSKIKFFLQFEDDHLEKEYQIYEQKVTKQQWF